MTDPRFVRRAEVERDPRAHELALQEATRAALADDAHSMLLKMSGDAVIGVDLVGGYPDTKVRITIQYSELRNCKVRSYNFTIWDETGRQTVRDPELMPAPGSFGINVAGWALEE